MPTKVKKSDTEIASLSPTKMTESVRQLKFEIDLSGDNSKEVRQRLIDTTVLCKKAANLFYETWLVWHVLNKSSVQIEQWLTRRAEVHRLADSDKKTQLAAIEARADFKTAKAKEKAKTEVLRVVEEFRKVELKKIGYCPVDCANSELSKTIYEALTRRYPSIQVDVVSLLMNTVLSTLKQRKATAGSLPGWMSILLHDEAMPSFTKRYPVPFDKKNGTLHSDGTHRYVLLKTHRYIVPGKANRTAIVDQLKLRMTGRSAKRHLQNFDRVVSGEWSFRGSSLTYDSRLNKFFINLCYGRPSHVVDLDPGRVAYLVPGRKIPFYVRTYGITKHEWLMGDGKVITQFRTNCKEHRAVLNVGNRKTMTLRGGHGRHAAMKSQDRVARKWREFTIRVNHFVSKRAVEYCVANNIGKLVYLQPAGQVSMTRVVSGDAADGSAWKGSTWPFDDLRTKLSYKCQDSGVEFERITCGKE